MVTSRRTQIGMRKPTKPCMIICPAMVPTTELETPDAISESRNTAGGADAEQGRQRVIGGFDLGDVAVARVEGARGHHHHRHVDQPGDRQRDHHLWLEMRTSLRRSLLVAARHARLREAGMQIDRVRHDGGADDADRDAAAPRRRAVAGTTV